MAASLARKVFVITGNASGMGYATATTLITCGATLGLCDVNEDGLSRLVNTLVVETVARSISHNPVKS